MSFIARATPTRFGPVYETDRELVLEPGGTLARPRWVYDQTTDTGSYQVFDLTERAPQLIFEPLSFHPECRVGDAFLLLARHADFFELALGNHCAKITQAMLHPSLSPEPDRAQSDSDEDLEEHELDYAELYWVAEACEGRMEGLSRPGFHALSKPLPADSRDGNWKRGEIIPYAVNFSLASQLADLPLREASRMHLCDALICGAKFPQLELPPPRLTLGSALHGILWELSFYGAPGRIQTLNAV